MSKKHMGQVFLKKTGFIKSYFKRYFIRKEPLIVEIGPGKGALTREIFASIDRVNLVLIERDGQLLPYLKEYPVRETIIDDFLSVEPIVGTDYIFGSLPYYCSKDIVMSLRRWSFRCGIFIVQREVADILRRGNGRFYWRCYPYLEFKFLRYLNSTMWNRDLSVDGGLILVLKRVNRPITILRFIELWNPFLDELWSQKRKMISRISRYCDSPVSRLRPENLDYLRINNLFVIFVRETRRLSPRRN